jgi:hypothetical protein
MMRGDLPIIFGIDCNGNARPIAVDEFGRIILSIDGCNPSSQIICTSDCAVGGKAIQFTAGDRTLIVSSATQALNPIQIFVWSQEPNIELNGMTLLFEKNVGESFAVTFTNIIRWISIFAINPVHGYYDGCCLILNSNIIQIVGFD